MIFGYIVCTTKMILLQTVPCYTYDVYEISKDAIESLKVDRHVKQDPGRADLVHDDMELEFLAIDNHGNELPGLMVESEAREHENDDTVTEASSRVVHMPNKHDRFKLTAAEISFKQIKPNLIVTLSFP